MNRILGHIAQIGTIVIRIKDKACIHRTIKTSQIICLESRLNTLIFHLRDGTDVKTSGRLDEYSEFLSKFRFFLRCHKSFLINLNCVEVMKKDSVLLENGEVINISRRKRDACRDKYFKYIQDKIKGSTT